MIVCWFFSLILKSVNMIGLIIVVSIAGIVIYFVRKFQKVAEKYKTIPGISLLEFFKDPKNIPIKTAAHANEKFAKIITPVTVFVLATHPDSAKVKLDLIKFVLID
jgi:hypothetical protein